MRASEINVGTWYLVRWPANKLTAIKVVESPASFCVGSELRNKTLVGVLTQTGKFMRFPPKTFVGECESPVNLG